MSIASKQAYKAANEAIRALFIKGSIPSPSTALSEIAKKENIAGAFGLPRFKANFQGLRDKSNVRIYNENIAAFISDMQSVYEEQIDQGTKVDRQLAASELEFNKLLKDIRVIGDKANEIVSSYDILQKYGFYLFDTFNNVDKLDLFRTTAFVDTEAGAIELPIDRVIKVDLSHLQTQDTGKVSVLWPPDGKLSQVDGTRFGNMFDDSISAWILSVATTKHSDRAKIRFDMKLGNPLSPSVETKYGQEFNRIVVRTLVPVGDLDTDRSVVLYYKNSLTSGFEAFRLTSFTIDGTDVIMDIDMESIAGWSQTPQSERHIKTHIRELRVEMSKSLFDQKIGDLEIYFFSVASIEMYRNKYKSAAVATSKSNKIQGNNFIGTLNNVSMAVSQSVPANTAVNYYVAEDNYLHGHFIDGEGAWVPPLSPDISGFLEKTYEEMPNPETSGVLQTELREWAISNTGYYYQGINYANWIPDWRKIIPVDGGVTEEDGDTGENVVKFENTSDFDSDARASKRRPIWSNPAGLPEDTINNIDFYRVVDFYDAVQPGNMELRQGKDAWIRVDEITYLIQTIEASGQFDGDAANPTYTAPGPVVRGSVRDVHAALSRPEEFLTEGVHYATDYGYDYVNIQRRFGTPDEIYIESDQVIFKVDYKIATPTKTWVTYQFLEEDSSAIIEVNMAGVDKVQIRNRDRTTGAIIGEITETVNGTFDLTEIGVGFGWYEIRIEVRTDTWSPTLGDTLVTKPATVKQYAWMSPLRVVSYHDLTNNVPKREHGYTAVSYPDSREFLVQDDGRSSVWLAVNDPTYPPTGVYEYEGLTISHYNLADGSGITATDIFADDASISKFYDIAYTAIAEIADHVLVRIDLSTSDPDITPRVDGYAVRILN